MAGRGEDSDGIDRTQHSALGDTSHLFLAQVSFVPHAQKIYDPLDSVSPSNLVFRYTVAEYLALSLNQTSPLLNTLTTQQPPDPS